MTPEQIAELIRERMAHAFPHQRPAAADRYTVQRIDVLMEADYLTDGQRIQQVRDTLAARGLVEAELRGDGVR